MLRRLENYENNHENDNDNNNDNQLNLFEKKEIWEKLSEKSNEILKIQSDHSEVTKVNSKFHIWKKQSMFYMKTILN